MVVVVAIVVEGNAVEFFERICNLAHGCCETRVEGHTLHPRGSNVYALALLYIAEVRRLDALALVWDDGRFHVS